MHAHACTRHGSRRCRERMGAGAGGAAGGGAGGGSAALQQAQGARDREPEELCGCKLGELVRLRLSAGRLLVIAVEMQASKLCRVLS